MKHKGTAPNKFKKIFFWVTSLWISYSLIACQGTNNSQQAAPPPQQMYGPNYQYGQFGPNGPYGNYGYPGYPGQPMPVGCMNGTMNCQMAMYNNYNAYGFMPYQMDPYAWGGYYNYYNMQYGGMGVGYLNFCNCPVGYRPVYNGYMGMGCLQATFMQPYIGTALYWGLRPNNYQWVNQTQISNVQGYNNTTSCYGNVAQSCFVDQTGSCGPGAYCQITAAGSRLGICVSNRANNNNGIYR